LNQKEDAINDYSTAIHIINQIDQKDAYDFEDLGNAYMGLNQLENAITQYD